MTVLTIVHHLKVQQIIGVQIFFVGYQTTVTCWLTINLATMNAKVTIDTIWIGLYNTLYIIYFIKFFLKRHEYFYITHQGSPPLTRRIRV